MSHSAHFGMRLGRQKGRWGGAASCTLDSTVRLLYVDAVFIVELQSGLKQEIASLLHWS